MQFDINFIADLERSSREKCAQDWDKRDLVLASAELKLANAAKELLEVLQQRSKTKTPGEEFAKYNPTRR